MDDEEGLYLENIDEFINDEDRIVTYKWLSRTLSVPSNRAKQMLYSYLAKHKEDKNANNISATYLVGGNSNIDGQMIQQFVLTNDDNLDDTKSCFDVITSVHIYSLQKITPKDSNAFYTVDYGITQKHKDETNRWNHIHCKEAKAFEDGGTNRAKGRGRIGKENNEPASKSNSTLNGQGSSSNSEKPKASNQKSRKGQLPTMGMFASKNEKKHPAEKKEKKPPAEKEEEQKPSEASKEKPTEEKKQKSSKTSKPSGTMLSFFGKPVSAQKTAPEKKEEKTKNVTPEKETKTTPDKKKEEKKEKSPPKREETKKKANKPEKATKTSSKGKDKKETPEKKPEESKKTSKQTRKRIKTLDSSDEEEEPIPKKFNKLASDSDSNSENDVKPKKSQAKKNKDTQEKETASKKKNSNKKEKEKEKIDKETKQDENQEKPTKGNRKRKKELKSVSSEEESPIGSKLCNKTVISETPVSDQHSSGNPTKQRKRRKVMRSKTYVDDDGFMVTEKVYESESTDASDEEVILVKQEQPKAKKISPDSKPKKVTELKPAKQASLMSFFKKT